MDLWIIPVIVFVVILVIAIGITAAPAVERTVQTISPSLDKIQGAAGTICEIDATIYDRIRNAFGNEPKVMEMLDQINTSPTWSSCGLDQLYKYLGEENRKRIGWFEFACDVSHCTQALGAEPKP